jgi:hypothetical protein
MRRFLLAGLVIVTACVSGTETPPGTVAQLLVTSNQSPNGVFVGDQVQLSATPVDLDGDPVTVATAINYTSSNTAVATINSSGLIIALSAGTTLINVTAGGASASLTLSIDGNVSGSVIVVPSTATVSVGGQQQYAFAVSTTLGNPARAKSVNWSTGDGTKAQVNASGLATALAATAGVSICATATDAPTATGCGTLTITP